MANPGPFKSGSHDSLQKAMDEAHKKAADAGMAGQWLVVKDIHVKGDNPIREYIVTLGPGSP